MKIFVADYLPLANKGEEEILRGIEVLFKKGNDNISFSVFGDVTETCQQGNVTVYPKKLLYPDYNIEGKCKTLWDLIIAFMGLIGLYPYRRNLKEKSLLFEEIQNSDFVLIGHDGFFNLRCAMLGNYLNKKGVKYGILGAGFSKPGWKIAWLYDKVYKRCFDNAKYIILREKTTFDYVKSISDNQIIELLPDPAFFCPDKAYNIGPVENIIKKYGIENGDKLKIGMTICEDSVSFSKAFLSCENKVESHRDFIAKLMTMIAKNYNCIFYFLPHCIKEGKGNDLIIARDIKNRIESTVDCRIIEEEMPVLDLKFIISQMDLMIGERTHSIINSIATGTPFVSLTCTADLRTHDIVGEGCKLFSQIYDLDNPEIAVLYELVERTVKGMAEQRATLLNICQLYKEKKNYFQEII